MSPAQIAVLHRTVAVQHVFDIEAMLSSHVILQAGRNPSMVVVVALQLKIHVWHQHDSSAEDQLRITDPLVKMVLSYRNRTLVPVFFASAPFRLISFSSLVAAPRWKLCLYCFLLRLQGNGQKECVIILPVCSESWQKHRSFGWSDQGQMFNQGCCDALHRQLMYTA